MASSKSGNRGFSLAELMAAMVILSLGIFALLSVNAMTLRQASYNENAQTAHTIATGQLALVEGILKINFRAATTDLQTTPMQSVTFPDFFYIVRDGGFDNQRASEKAAANTDTSAQVLLLFEKLRSELRRGRIVECSESTLGYWIYDQENGLPQSGPGPHRLAFLPRGEVEPALAEITAQDTEGRLVRRFEGREDTLLKMGRDSLVKFSWTQSLQILRVEGSVGEKNESRTSLSSEKKFLFTVPLNNVE